MCSDGKRDLTFFKLEFFRISFGMKAFCSGFSALLPLDNYKLKSNQPFGASGVERKHLLETAKVCGSIRPALFLQT